MGLRNKVVLITGGSRGLGATTAKLFAVHGARVVINYRSSSAEAEELVAEIEAYGGEALAVQADVSSAAEVQRTVITGERGEGLHQCIAHGDRETGRLLCLHRWCVDHFINNFNEVGQG